MRCQNQTVHRLYRQSPSFSESRQRCDEQHLHLKSGNERLPMGAGRLTYCNKVDIGDHIHREI